MFIMSGSVCLLSNLDPLTDAAARDPLISYMKAKSIMHNGRDQYTLIEQSLY